VFYNKEKSEKIGDLLQDYIHLLQQSLSNSQWADKYENKR
jgi:hypothetical protein